MQNNGIMEYNKSSFVKDTKMNLMHLAKVFAFLFILFFGSCSKNEIPVYTSETFILQFNDYLHSRVIPAYKNTDSLFSCFQPSEYVWIDNDTIEDFSREYHTLETDLRNDIGVFDKLVVSGMAQFEKTAVEKKVIIQFYDEFPAMALYHVSYINHGDEPMMIRGWANHAFEIESNRNEPMFWSFQSGTYSNRPDWVLPLNPGFHQTNFMGMNASDYGGGTPVTDIWRKDVGIAVGHAALVPKRVSLPVKVNMQGTKVTVGIYNEISQELMPGDSIKLPPTFFLLHKGDYYNALKTYSRFMQKKGIPMHEPSKASYEPVWCAWGYERNFSVDEIVQTLPKVKELGFEWAVIDDGWQPSEGDWYPLEKKFPKGDEGMKDLVKKIHDQGLKAKLWWAPLAADPESELYKQHPEMALINENGTTQDISWWDSYYLCPAYEGTIDYSRKLVEKFIGEWKFDGLKIDGQHLNAAPPCYNSAHHHEYPEKSYEQLPEFWKMVYETAKEINPDAVIEICPCGTACSFYLMSWMDQPVSSDPLSSWQIRLKGKTYKALMGPQTAYYGDHVELSDGGIDFASTIGIGGVIGSKFTWPNDRLEHDKNLLTEKKELSWNQWMGLYLHYMLPLGEYKGHVYDIGFDKPEGHLIKKGNNYYFAFYSDNWNGQVELRGLENKSYIIKDYVNQKMIGEVTGPKANIDLSFKGYILLEAIPNKTR